MLHTLLSHLVKINWRSEGAELGTSYARCPSLTCDVLVHEENSNCSKCPWLQHRPGVSDLQL